MTEQQIPKLMGTMVEHQNEFTGLSTEDAQWAIQNPKQAIALCVEAITKRLNLFDLVGTIEIPATDKFVTRDKFVLDTSGKTELPISYLGTNFQDWFLGKVEEPACESTLCCQRLRRTKVNAPIIAELGGKDKAETTLGQLYEFLKQADRKEGFIFYVCDLNGVLCAVYAYWRSVGGWRVNALSVEGPHRWDEASQVVSPQF